MLKRLLFLLTSFCILSIPLPAHAETKVLTAEGTYTMGEGETMTFAESMALQKAKQMALEQAGTYVESYTKVQNYQLTANEIQTIAGGVLQVEVLDKTRTLVGDGLKFFVKINATITTDKVSELAQRIKEKNVVEEYKKLQEDYARLSKEIESWKQLIAKTPSGPERDAALDQIREKEKAFAVAQKSEAALFQRLVQGDALVRKALDEKAELDRKALDEKAEVDRLIEKLKEPPYTIELGESRADIVPESPDELVLTVPATIKFDIPRLNPSEISAFFLSPDRIFYYGTRGIAGTTYKKIDPLFLILPSRFLKSNVQRYFVGKLKTIPSGYQLQLALVFATGGQQTCNLSSLKLLPVIPVKIITQDGSEFETMRMGIAVDDLDSYRGYEETVAFAGNSQTLHIQFRLTTKRAKEIEQVTAKLSTTNKKSDMECEIKK